MNSQRQVMGKLGHVVQVHVCCKRDFKSLYQLKVCFKQLRHISCNTKALQFPQSVVTFLASAHITKPELFDWKLCLVSEETAVFTPYFVITITVTTMTGDRT